MFFISDFSYPIGEKTKKKKTGSLHYKVGGLEAQTEHVKDMERALRTQSNLFFPRRRAGAINYAWKKKTAFFYDAPLPEREKKVLQHLFSVFLFSVKKWRLQHGPTCDSNSVAGGVDHASNIRVIREARSSFSNRERNAEESGRKGAVYNNITLRQWCQSLVIFVFIAVLNAES